MKEYKAKYQIRDAFSITGRGLVFAGTVLEGVINIGDFMVLNFKGKNLKGKITAIEGISGTKSTPNTGIMVEFQGEKEITALKDWKPNNVIAKIL